MPLFRPRLREWLFDMFVNDFLARPVISRRWRWRGLRLAGVDVRGAVVAGDVRFGNADVHIGVGTYIGPRCLLDSLAPITIGERCNLGMGVMLITGSHVMGTEERRAGPPRNAPVVIGDGTWLGAGVTVLPGVTIGSGCVIGAGSVVTRDCPPDGVYVGTPATRVREAEAEPS